MSSTEPHSVDETREVNDVVRMPMAEGVAVLPVRGISCICFACDSSPELNRMRQACQQKKIPLAVFVHQPGDNALATEKEAITDIPLIQDLLVLEDAHS